MVTKRFLSLLLTLCCLLALMPAVPAAVQAAPENGSGTIAFQPNPLYKDMVDPGAFDEPSNPMPVPFDDEIEYISMSAAEKELRKAMVNRYDYVTLHYTTKGDVVESLSTLPEKAMAHTGSPKEGDYLKFTYGGWGAKYSYSYYNDMYHVDASYNLYYYTTAAQEATMDDHVANLLDSLDLYNASDYQKIKGIYDYITGTVCYDYDHMEDESYLLQYTAYAALVNKTAVCQGYANLFYRLALELDVDCRIISGYGNGPHAWNITQLDKQWYNLDPTWDEGRNEYGWFLLSADSFQNHTRDDEYEASAFHNKYPMAKEDYTYDAVRSNIQIDTELKDITVNDGEVVKFTLKARGKDLKYQWYFKNPGSSSYTKSSNTGDTYSATMTKEKSGRKIYCKITDGYGNTLKTPTISITVTSPIEITESPKGMAVAEGETATATVKATGNGLKYQWYFKNPGSDTYSKSSNTTATYSTEMTKEKSGRKIVCEITDKDGNSIKTSAVTLSQINITKQPDNGYAKLGETAKITLKASGSDLKYQWYYKNPGAEKFTKSSYTTTTYPCKLTEDNDGRRVYCKVTDKYGNSVNTKAVSFKIAQPPKITEQPKGIAVAAGETAKVTVKASGTGLKYQWYFKNKGDSNYTKSSNTTATYSTEMTKEKSGRQIYCVITGATGEKVTTKTVVLSVIDITKQPKNTSVAAGSTVKVEITAKGDGLTYQWYFKNPGSDAFSKSSITGATYSTEMTKEKSGRRVYCKITDQYGNSVNTNVATLKTK